MKKYLGYGCFALAAFVGYRVLTVPPDPSNKYGWLTAGGLNALGYWLLK